MVPSGTGRGTAILTPVRETLRIRAVTSASSASARQRVSTFASCLGNRRRSSPGVVNWRKKALVRFNMVNLGS